MKFAPDHPRPYANPETAARKLIEIACAALRLRPWQRGRAPSRNTPLRPASRHASSAWNVPALPALPRGSSFSHRIGDGLRGLANVPHQPAAGPPPRGTTRPLRDWQAGCRFLPIDVDPARPPVRTNTSRRPLPHATPCRFAGTSNQCRCGRCASRLHVTVALERGRRIIPLRMGSRRPLRPSPVR